MQVLVRVERPEKLDDEWVISKPLHDFEFAEDLLVPALFFHDESLRHRLYRVQSTRIFLAHQIHFLSEATLTDDLHFLVVLHGHA